MSLKVIIVLVTHEQWLVMLKFKGETGEQGRKYENVLLCIDLLHLRKRVQIALSFWSLNSRRTVTYHR